MKKKTKRNLIIAAIVIVLIVAGAAWFAYPFIRYGLHLSTYRSALPEDACYQYPIQYSKEGWFLIDCTLNGTHLWRRILGESADGKHQCVSREKSSGIVHFCYHFFW